MKQTIYIPGDPVGKQRPRVTRFGTYTPEKTRKYEEAVRLIYLHQYGHNSEYEGPVKLNIIAEFRIPSSWNKTQKGQALKGIIRPKKPDFDNICKTISDALNGVAYKDDAQVYKCSVEKKYSETPGVTVEIIIMK